MEDILFASNEALTPVSELKQMAKAQSRETGETLTTCLDAQAASHGFPRWDSLIDQAWRLSGSEAEAGKIFEIEARDGRRRTVIGFAENRIHGREIAVDVWRKTARNAEGEDILIRFHEFAGCKIPASDDDIWSIRHDQPLQARARNLIRLTRGLDGKVPVQIGNPSRYRAFQAECIGEASVRPDLPKPAGEVLIAVEIPNSKDRVELSLSVPMTVEDFQKTYRKDDIPGLYGFNLQKDGSVLLRRAKVDSAETAMRRLGAAARELSFHLWSGLHYPRGNEKYNVAWKTSSEVPRGPFSDLYDHYSALVHRQSGCGVVLNQPYWGDSKINRIGLLNLLSPGTITIETEGYAGPHQGSRTLFHALDDGRVNLEAIAAGAVAGAWFFHDAEVRRVSPAKRKQAARGAGRRKAAVSLVEDITVDWDKIPMIDKVLLNHHLPDIDKLRTPSWRAKMKAFEGKEHLSWELQDRYNSTGIGIMDVINAVKRCPLDGDVWGFLDLFDLSEDARIEVFKRGAVASEIYLGKMMTQEVGYFWGLVQTRPYMRCMNSLYRALVKAERPEDALLIGNRMLELCPNDNIGIRFSIEAVKEATRDKDAAREVADAFRDEEAKWDM